MKTKNTRFLTVLISLLVFSSLGSQENTAPMKITGKSGILLSANRGQEDGVQFEWVFDVKRIVKADTLQVGIAVVQQIEAKTCFLTPFSVNPFQPKPNDVLIKNEALTQSLACTQSQKFWDEIEARRASTGALDFVDGRLFQNCKITLKNGDELKVKNLVVKRNEGILIPQKYTVERELIPIDRIQSIRAPTGNYALIGALIGAALGGGAILLLEDRVEIDTTYYPVKLKDQTGKVIGTTQRMLINKTEHRLSLDMKIGLVGGGYVLGSVIGCAFKGLWREIYASENPVGKVSLKWNITQPQQDAIGVNLKVQF